MAFCVKYQEGNTTCLEIFSMTDYDWYGNTFFGSACFPKLYLPLKKKTGGDKKTRNERCC